MRGIVLILAVWHFCGILQAEMFVQTPQAKRFADLVETALQINDTDNPDIEAQIVAAQKQIAGMGSVADKQLIQMVSEWLTLSEQGQLNTIQGLVYPNVALAFASQDPNAVGPLLSPLVGWMDRLAEGKMHDEGIFAQRAAMFIAAWGGEAGTQSLKSDMDKLLASTVYDAHMTGLEIQRALDGQPSGPRRLAHLKSSISQWCQGQIDFRKDLQAKPIRRDVPQAEQDQILRPKSTSSIAQPVPQATKPAVASSTSYHLWLWGAAGAVVLIVIYFLMTRRA